MPILIGVIVGLLCCVLVLLYYKFDDKEYDKQKSLDTTDMVEMVGGFTGGSEIPYHPNVRGSMSNQVYSPLSFLEQSENVYESRISLRKSFIHNEYLMSKGNEYVSMGSSKGKLESGKRAQEEGAWMSELTKNLANDHFERSNFKM